MQIIDPSTNRPFESEPARYFRGQPGSMRGFEGAQTDRLNNSQWANTGGTVNEDISLGLVELRNRCLYEMENNGFVEGVIATHVTDIVGENGPTLQIESENETFNKRLKTAWAEWWDVAGADGSSGPELLQMMVRLLWWAGESLHQIVEAPDGEKTASGVSMRLHEVHPRRLTEPLTNRSADGNAIIQGVEIDGETGRPLVYHIERFLVDQRVEFGPAGSIPVAAANIIHWFKRIEPGQVRGFPLLSPSLQAIRDVRDYDAETLDAARAAANFNVLLSTDHADAPFLNTNECVDMERRVIRTVPPGWKPNMIKAEQPTTNYVDFRTERHREIGRPAQMPAMIIRLDSAKHNFSSARFDGQRYDRGNRSMQAQLTRKWLMRALRIVQRQAQLDRTRPAEVTISFVWPTSPHVDPTKEAKAWETLLKIGVVDEFKAAAALGFDYETVCAMRARAAKCREENGLNSEAAADDDGEGGLRAAIRRTVETLVEEMVEDETPNTVTLAL